MCCVWLKQSNAIITQMFTQLNTTTILIILYSNYSLYILLLNKLNILFSLHFIYVDQLFWKSLEKGNWYYNNLLAAQWLIISHCHLKSRSPGLNSFDWKLSVQNMHVLPKSNTNKCLNGLLKGTRSLNRGVLNHKMNMISEQISERAARNEQS